jgi:hypothetical protein
MIDTKEQFNSFEQVDNGEESFEDAAGHKKMSMFAEFFANHPKMKKAANAAALFVILTKGLIMVGDAQAAEKPEAHHFSDPKALEFIDDVKNNASAFENVALPEGMHLVFKSHDSAHDNGSGEKLEGDLGDSGKNIFVSSYAGSAIEEHNNDIHEQSEYVKVIGQAAELTPNSSHSGDFHGHGHTKAEAIAGALARFSEQQMQKVDSHQLSIDNNTEIQQGGKTVIEDEKNFNSITEITSSHYISSYEVSETHEENGGKYTEVTVHVVGGAPVEQVAGVEK